MRSLLVLAAVGLFAQLVDGSLGMAYGVTSSTMLIAVGIAPSASAAVHLSEVGTTLVSGAAHWKLGNIDWRTVSIIAVLAAVAWTLAWIQLIVVAVRAEQRSRRLQTGEAAAEAALTPA